MPNVDDGVGQGGAAVVAVLDGEVQHHLDARAVGANIDHHQVGRCLCGERTGVSDGDTVQVPVEVVPPVVVVVVVVVVSVAGVGSSLFPQATTRGHHETTKTQALNKFLPLHSALFVNL